MSAALESAPFGFVLLAVGTGLLAGFGAVGFRMLIAFFHNLIFLGVLSFHYDARLHTAASPWGAWIILGPVVGAIVVATLIRFRAPEARGAGVPEVMDAIYYKRGIIRPVVAGVKALAASISIGSGASIGREGPIIQIGSAFGSTLGQVFRVAEWQRMTLIACGAAGGIAATFNTPIGGLLYAVELIMPEISARTLIPVALSSGGATFVSRIFLGNHPAFDLPTLSFIEGGLTSPALWAAYLVFGLVLGLWSAFFIRALYGTEDLLDKVPGGYIFRHAASMLLVGAMMYLMLRYTGHYYVQGVGYATIQDILGGQLAIGWFLLLLVVLKLVATALSLGSGGSGGIFSPTIFMGACFGGAYAIFGDALFPGLGMHPITAGVVGMAGMLGGATGAAVTAIVMVFEMTRDYHVIIPLMVTVSVAYGVRRLIMESSAYDMKLRRRGHVIPNVLQTNLYLLERARDRISTPVLRVSPKPNIERLARLLGRGRRTPHVIVVEHGAVRTVIPASTVRGFRKVEALAAAVEHHEERGYVVVADDDMLFDVIGRMREAGCEIALVTGNGEMNSVDEIRGVLSLADVVHGTQLPRPLLERRRGSA